MNIILEQWEPRGEERHLLLVWNLHLGNRHMRTIHLGRQAIANQFPVQTVLPLQKIKQPIDNNSISTVSYWLMPMRYPKQAKGNNSYNQSKQQLIGFWQDPWYPNPKELWTICNSQYVETSQSPEINTSTLNFFFFFKTKQRMYNWQWYEVIRIQLQARL